MTVLYPVLEKLGSPAHMVRLSAAHALEGVPDTRNVKEHWLVRKHDVIP
jgi:hypothetical protein